MIAVHKIEKRRDNQPYRNPPCYASYRFQYGNAESEAQTHLGRRGVLPVIHQRGGIDGNIARTCSSRQHQQHIQRRERTQSFRPFPRHNQQGKAGYRARTDGPVRDGKNDDTKVKEHVEQRQDDIARPCHAYDSGDFEAQITLLPWNRGGILLPDIRTAACLGHNFVLLVQKENTAISSCKTEKK